MKSNYSDLVSAYKKARRTNSPLLDKLLQKMEELASEGKVSEEELETLRYL